MAHWRDEEPLSFDLLERLRVLSITSSPYKILYTAVGAMLQGKKTPSAVFSMNELSKAPAQGFQPNSQVGSAWTRSVDKHDGWLDSLVFIKI